MSLQYPPYVLTRTDESTNTTTFNSSTSGERDEQEYEMIFYREKTNGKYQLYQFQSSLIADKEIDEFGINLYDENGNLYFTSKMKPMRVIARVDLTEDNYKNFVFKDSNVQAIALRAFGGSIPMVASCTWHDGSNYPPFYDDYYICTIKTWHFIPIFKNGELTFEIAESRRTQEVANPMASDNVPLTATYLIIDVTNL